MSNQQATIFMAQQQQQSESSTPSIILNIQNFKCVYCNQSRYKNGFFRIFKDIGFQVFCSKKCADAEKKRRKKLVCKCCGKTFENWNSIKNRKYCSKICGRKMQPDWYEIYNWCDLCNKWIPKDKSIKIVKGSKNAYRYKRKKDHYFCPTCNTELRTDSKHYKNIDK